MRPKSTKTKSGSNDRYSSRSKSSTGMKPNKDKIKARPYKSRKPDNSQRFQAVNSGPKRLVLFNKPFNTLCQFTGEAADDTLANYIDVPHVYSAGRLDKDSEGLLLLTNDGRLQNRLSHPKFNKEKTYWVQVEGNIDPSAIQMLSQGVELKDGTTKPASAALLDPNKGPNQLWERNPPVRFRKNIPTSWLSLTISEGKNRQVRRMTAAVGYPTLRLVRVSIDKWHIDKLKPGEYRVVEL